MLKDPTFERLNGGNYHIWEFRARMELKKLELWDVIAEYNSCPSQDQTTKLTAWRRRDDKAMGYLSLGWRRVRLCTSGTNLQ